MFTFKDISQALARGYCHAPNVQKELDSSLIMSMSHEIAELLESKGFHVSFNIDRDI